MTQCKDCRDNDNCNGTLNGSVCHHFVEKQTKITSIHEVLDVRCTCEAWNDKRIKRDYIFEVKALNAWYTLNQNTDNIRCPWCGRLLP